MKAQTISITLAAAMAAFGAGCSSTDTYGDHSNRNRGAVAGAAAGAVLGGVIAANSDKASTEQGAAAGAVAGGLAGAVLGSRQDRNTNTTSAPVYSSSDAGYRVQSIPPTPVSEPQESVPPQPAPNAVWIRGHYAWTGSGYQWQSGRWEIPPAGARMWVQPSWQPAQNGGYVYVRGHWQ
jgi:hypothetical protein